MNRFFVLSFEHEKQRASYKRFFIPTGEIKNYNFMTVGRKFFDQSVRHKLMTYDSNAKVPTVQWDDYTNGYLLDYDYLKNYYKMIAIALRKQQALDADPKAIQQTNFTVNLAQQATIFFIVEEAKEFAT